MILRPYQRTALDAVHAAIDSRPILVLPTGGGKTYTAGQLLVERGARTLWLAHRRELITQAATSIHRLGLDVGAVMAGIDPRPRAQVQVASVQTLRRRTAPAADLVVVDECHHARAQTYRDVLDQYPGTPVVGLTATPFRLDGKGLGDLFGHIVVGAYPDELCDDGTLVDPVVYAPASPDLTGVRKVHGDFNMRDVGERMRKPRLVGDIVSTWQQRAAGKRTVVYATSVEHSRQIEAAFKAAGVRVEHLDGSTPKALRDAILFRLREAYTTVVCNVQVLEEGWDLPALDCAIVARPTASLCLHLQMIGRIMRAAEGKAGAVVLDHAGNHLRHGPVTQRLDYTLADRAGDAERECAGGSIMKRCPKCFLVVRRAAAECPECAHRFVGREVEHVAGELVPYEAGAVTATRPPLAAQQATWNSLEAQRSALGYREDWTFLRFRDRFGFRPLVWQGAVCDPATVGPAVKVAVFRNLEAAGERAGHKSGWASHCYREIFGGWPPFKRSTA